MTRQPLRAPPLPSSEGSHTTSENTLAVCHRRRPHQVHSLLLQAVEFLDPARTQEPPCASQEICHLKSPPSNYFPDPRAMKLQPGQRGLQTACSHPTGAFPQPRLLNLGRRPRPEGLAPQVSLAAPASGHEGGQAHCLGAFISLKSWPGFWSLALRSRPEWQLGKQFQPDAPEYLFGAGQAPGTPGEDRGGPFHRRTPAVPAHVSLRSAGPFPRQTLVEMP